MRRTRTAAALLGGATLVSLSTLSVLSAPAAVAKDSDTIWVSPSEAEPGQTVTIKVTCDTSSVKTITAGSQAFDGGSATLTVGPDGKYTGTVKLASKEEFEADGPDRVKHSASWGIDGKCPSGESFIGSVSVEREGHSPHGGMRTGLGGSVAGDGAQLAAGGALVAAGVGGFWLLRRRSGRPEQSF